MQTLGNLVIGAVLAGLSLGPSAWADTRIEADHLMARAATIIVGKNEAGSALDHAVATARGTLSHLPGGERLRN
jgi:hypothetical protein